MEVSCKATGFCSPNVRSVNHIGLFQIVWSLNSYLLNSRSIELLLCDHKYTKINDTLNMHHIGPSVSSVRNIEFSSK